MEAILISFLLNLAYLAAGLIVLRLIVAYLNTSSVTGEKFTFSDAMEKVYEDPHALSIVVAGALVALALLMSAFIRG